MQHLFIEQILKIYFLVFLINAKNTQSDKHSKEREKWRVGGGRDYGGEICLLLFLELSAWTVSTNSVIEVRV